MIMTAAPVILDIAPDRIFALTFDRQIETRESVLLGVVPIGAIERNGLGRWQWSLTLPVVERMHRAGSIEEARERVRDVVRNWLEAATAERRDRRAAR